MTVRVAMAAMAAVITSLLACACASRGGGSGHHPATGIVDTFTRSGTVSQPSARNSPLSAKRSSAQVAPACAQGANGTSFAFSIASSAKGYSTPREAAVQFSRHNQVSAPAVAAGAWTSTKLVGGYALGSAHVAVHVVCLQGRDWIVDSGTVCR